MFSDLIQYDKELFLWLNFDGGSFMDTIMSYASAKLTWVPLYLLVLFLIWRRHGWKYTLIAAVAIALAVVAVDQVCNVFKNELPKLRPTRNPEFTGLIHRVSKPGGGIYTGGMYGTVSAHAATTFTIVVISSMIVRKRWFTAMMIVWAILVGYSRIYVGVHYPLDIFFGTMLGIATGFLIMYIVVRIIRRYRSTRNPAVGV
ncbi:phosphatase PAP2 family protein [Alistipes sp. OttesenSCG-928-B03]|nr:phosphatase PAP2 family protein [Alistipes sp. OttesenSCG-928-B03]